MMSRRALLPLAAGIACTALTANAQEAPEVNVRQVGREARAWLLVHPLGGSGRFWDNRAATLAANRGIRVFSPDLPSHGRSRIVRQFSYAAAADAIEAAMAAHAESVELIVGASSGSVVAMKLAARWRKPVVAVGGWLAFEPVNTERMRAQARALPAATVQFVDAFLEQGDAQRAAIQRHYGDLAALGQTPLLSEAERGAIADRTLLINGAADTAFSRASAHTLADAIENSVLVFASGADHLEPLGAPRSRFTWAQIEAFLATRL